MNGHTRGGLMCEYMCGDTESPILIPLDGKWAPLAQQECVFA